MRKEKWVALDGVVICGKNYAVSSYGKIRNVKTGRILKAHDNGRYLQVQLYENGKSKFYYIHRLVAMAFLDNYDNFPCVNHMDENTRNNNLQNLEWCTVEYNNNYGNHNLRVSQSNRKKVS